MMTDEGVNADDGFDVFGAFLLRRGTKFLAILHTPFDEHRQGCSGKHPMAVVGHSLQPGSIDSGRGQEMIAFEILTAETQPFHHRQEKFRMGFPQRETSGLFLVDVFGQHVTDRKGRVLSQDPRQVDRKVSNIDGVLVLEVSLELGFGEPARRKMLPGPVMFGVHDIEKRFKEHRFLHARGHDTLPSWVVRRYNLGRREQPMNPITIQNPDEILNVLADVTLRGAGFTTDSLLDYVLEEGFTEPIFLNASGEDPTAFFKGQPNAWAIYQVREWKRVLTISGGPGQERRARITETP